MNKDQELILLFDGDCTLCNGSVQFVINRDPKAKIKFASLQSEKAQEILKSLNAQNPKVDSIIFIEMQKVLVKSTAALSIVKHLAFPWPMLYSLMIIPKFIRDFFYDIIARNRYKWFGKTNSCMLEEGNKNRFL